MFCWDWKVDEIWATKYACTHEETHARTKTRTHARRHARMHVRTCTTAHIHAHAHTVSRTHTRVSHCRRRRHRVAGKIRAQAPPTTPMRRTRACHCERGSLCGRDLPCGAHHARPRRDLHVPSTAAGAAVCRIPRVRARGARCEQEGGHRTCPSETAPPGSQTASPKSLR